MHTEDHGTEIHLDKIEARAGSRNKTNRNALVGGLLLVIILFIVILGFGYLQTDRTRADEVASKSTGVKPGGQ